MIDKLRKIFPSATTETDVQQEERHLFAIYTPEENGENIAIKKEELTEKDKQLLDAFFGLNQQTDTFRPGDNDWYAYLLEEGPLPPSLDQLSPFCFFHLKGKRLYENQADLYETLHYYFDEPLKTVFLQKNILLVLVPDRGAGIFDPGELAGLLASDVLLDVFVYAGRRIHATEDIRAVYNQENLLFRQAQTLFPKERSFKEYEILPFVLPLLEYYQQKQLYRYAFAGLEQEAGMIETLYHFFLCNLNSSLAAKQLHMHRNTLQYRLDKLMDRTGIDIKQFPNAAALYTLIRFRK